MCFYEVAKTTYVFYNQHLFFLPVYQKSPCTFSLLCQKTTFFIFLLHQKPTSNNKCYERPFFFCGREKLKATMPPKTRGKDKVPRKKGSGRRPGSNKAHPPSPMEELPPPAFFRKTLMLLSPAPHEEALEAEARKSKRLRDEMELPETAQRTMMMEPMEELPPPAPHEEALEAEARKSKRLRDEMELTETAQRTMMMELTETAQRTMMMELTMKLALTQQEDAQRTMMEELEDAQRTTMELTKKAHQSAREAEDAQRTMMEELEDAQRTTMELTKKAHQSAREAEDLRQQLRTTKRDLYAMVFMSCRVMFMSCLCLSRRVFAVS